MLTAEMPGLERRHAHCGIPGIRHCGISRSPWRQVATGRYPGDRPLWDNALFGDELIE